MGEKIGITFDAIVWLITFCFSRDRFICKRPARAPCSLASRWRGPCPLSCNRPTYV